MDDRQATNSINSLGSENIGNKKVNIQYSVNFTRSHLTCYKVVWLLWEAFSHTVVTTKTLLPHQWTLQWN